MRKRQNNMLKIVKEAEILIIRWQGAYQRLNVKYALTIFPETKIGIRLGVKFQKLLFLINTGTVRITIVPILFTIKKVYIIVSLTKISIRYLNNKKHLAKKQGVFYN